ncbi:MAG: ADP-ribosylation/Crystallin [Myxococcales bacterium]|nr:ADP-ribosylation/Crystallin [Myxococcales bacterium]
MNDRDRGALLGLAVGDALGTSFEFEAIQQPGFPELATGPATDITGGGPFGLTAGQITDDTQMAVCLARSLAAHDRVLDVEDVGARYVAWSREAFDIGNQTRDAIGRIKAGTAARDAGFATWRASGMRAAGNGSLMRTAPIAVAVARRFLHGDVLPRQGNLMTVVADAAMAESAITHADPRCQLACAVFDVAIAISFVTEPDGSVAPVPRSAPISAMRARAMHAGATAALSVATSRLIAAWPRAADATASAHDRELLAIASARDDLARDLEAATVDDPQLYTSELHLHDKAGFVRVALRLAFWHLLNTPSWRDAVVDTASRGGDADTNAAIVGALVGARDGATAIPVAWSERVLAATQRGSAAWADAHHPRHLLSIL